ncbi:tetratricopeptide repeat protein [Pontibacter oryzae]|uniref:DUF3808 domain-containing protein n=1 Tax=Pontibacter oryzae TaxID=2304593 RepID=A0A399SF21_9BACT|nr:DUF3808 domain-containing protein [Pontibacter oryzae]RIJ41594.1 DUF3808 domain-containing protein [Pontibacter oryzae]
MAKPHPFFLVLGLLLFSHALLASPGYTPRHQAAYQQLLSLQLKSGRQMTQNLPTQNTAATLLLANYADFLELCVQQDQSKYELLIRAQEIRLKKLKDLPQQDPWQSYAAAEVEMQLAMCNLLFGSRLSAAWHFRQAFSQYAENVESYPHFLPNRKNLGVLQALIGSVPDQYQWFLNIVGLKGSIKQGMANLQAATNPENPFHLEARLLQTVLLHMVAPEKEAIALEQIRQMASSQKNSLLMQFVAMHLLKKSKHGEEALAIYKHLPRRNSYVSFPYLHHMAADLYLYKGDYSKSVIANELFLQLHKGHHYLKSANYKLYLAYVLGNHKPQASWYLQQISKVGIEETEEDKYAAQYAEKSKQIKGLPFMRARLYYDGGYYQKALKELNQYQLPNAAAKATQAEYYYRKARIYHALDSVQIALPLYKQTIHLCQGTTLYFAPNAALQLGYIYLALKQPEPAKSYFNQARSYKGHAYKNSIDAKAKLALQTF